MRKKNRRTVYWACRAETAFCRAAQRRGPMEPCRETLARHLRTWLAVRRQLLKTVAGRLGVGLSTVSQWSHGRRFPRPVDIDRIAALLGVTPACLFCPRLMRSDQDGSDRLAHWLRPGEVTSASTGASRARSC